MCLKPSLSISRPILEEKTSFHEIDGNIALLRCLVWSRIHTSGLELERIRFFTNGCGYVLLAGRSGKYLLSWHRWNYLSRSGTERWGYPDDIYSGMDEEEIYEKLMEAEYGIHLTIPGRCKGLTITLWRFCR